MSGTKAAWATAWATAAMLAGTACSNSVTVSQTGGGGAGGSVATGGAGGAEMNGGAGGAGGAGLGGGVDPQGGASMVGGAAGADPSGGAGGTATCPPGNDMCTQCLSEQCAAVYCGCHEEIHCGGYLQCLGTCMMDDSACIQNCATVHQDGISPAILAADCAATTCDGSCNFGNPLNDCQKCLYTDCAPQMNACIADPECIPLIQCFQMCPPGDMMCGQACIGQHPDGWPEVQELRDCRNDLCDGPCD
jgi:hypothetical protein